MPMTGFARTITKHPIWATVGTVVGAVALVVTFVQINQDDKPAAVEVATVSFQTPTPIDAKAGGSDMDVADWEQTTAPATPIDVSLKNNGGTAAHIVKIETTVLDAKTVTCNHQGGGSLVSAYYGVTIPYNPFTEELSSDTVSTPVDYTVKPGSVDRMVITVGPEETGNGKAIVFAVQIRLIQENGDPLVLEPLALSQPDGVEQEIGSNAMFHYAETDPQCVSKQADALNHIFELTKAQAPEVVRLRQEFQPQT
jgi:hypothetical protein